MILMQPIIKDIILSISDDVVSNLTQSFEKTYYGKMNYSSKSPKCKEYLVIVVASLPAPPVGPSFTL